MKSTVQVRNHRTPQPAKVQAQTQAPAHSFSGLELPPDAPHHACLCIFDREHQEPAGKVPLTESEFDRVMWIGQKNGTNGGEFVAAAVREKLTRKPAVPVDFNELESAKNQSKCLLTLLAERIEFQCMPGYGGGEKNGDFAAGIASLIQLTNDRLDVAFNDLHNTISINSEVAQ